jgi:glycosyltransferase involved in cell wall biosynthesis
VRVAISALSIKPGQTGGGETVLRNLVRHLPLADPQTEYLLFVTRENRGLFEESISNLLIETVPAWIDSPGRRVAYEFFALPVVLRQKQVSLFLAFNQAFSPLISCPVVALAQNLLYYHYRDFYRFSVLGLRAWLGMEVRNLYFTLLNRFAARRAVHIIAVSETARQEIASRERVPLGKITTVPLAVSVGLDPRQSGRLVDEEPARSKVPGRFFLLVGALEPYKNIDRAIVALAQLRQQRGAEQTCLVVLGLDARGYGRHLRQIAAQEGIADAVHFLGHVPHAELGAWYQEAIALLLLSACEAFPLPPLEAMAWGTPVIASHLSSLPEVIGEGGVVIDPRDTGQLVAVMSRMLADCSFREEVIERGYRWVRQYSWEQTAVKMAEVFCFLAR